TPMTASVRIRKMMERECAANQYERPFVLLLSRLFVMVIICARLLGRWLLSFFCRFLRGLDLDLGIVGKPIGSSRDDFVARLYTFNNLNIILLPDSEFDRGLMSFAVCSGKHDKRAALRASLYRLCRNHQCVGNGASDHSEVNAAPRLEFPIRVLRLYPNLDGRAVGI